MNKGFMRSLGAALMVASCSWEGRAETMAKRLVSEDPRVRETALAELGRLGPRDRQGIASELARVLGERDVLAAEAAAKALGRIGGKAPEALPALVSALSGPAAGAASIALAEVGEAAVSPLGEALKDPDVAVRRWSVLTLGRIPASSSQAAATPLLAALGDEAAPVRAAAAQALASLGAAHPRILPSLLEALKDPEPEAADAAALALAKIGRAATPALRRALSSPDRRMRRLAARALETSGGSEEARLAAGYRREENRSAKERAARADLSGLRVRLERGACYGRCPTYTLSISGDGTVAFKGSGEDGARAPGPRKLSPARLRALLAEFFAADFEGMKDSYERYMVTDHPTVVLELFLEGRAKKVTHYHGDRSAPEELTRLENAVDAAAGVR